MESPVHHSRAPVRNSPKSDVSALSDAARPLLEHAFYSGQKTRIIGIPTATTRISSGNPILQ